VADGRVRLARVENEGKQQQQRINELEQRIEKWTTRAKAVGDSDRAKALDCLKHRSDDQLQLEQAKKAQQKHEQMQLRMQDKVRTLEQRVTNLQRQHMELKTRDSVSRATTQLNEVTCGPGIDIEDTFDRWEVSIREREMRTDCELEIETSTTSLEDEFELQEQHTEMNDELDRLLSDKE